jgi:putative transposase
MARMARVVVPGLPHHITQRGNRRERVFFGAEDYRLYRRPIATAARRANAEVWACCLMPNHVYLIVTPSDEDGPRGDLCRGHRRYIPSMPGSNWAIYSRAASARS